MQGNLYADFIHFTFSSQSRYPSFLALPLFHRNHLIIAPSTIILPHPPRHEPQVTIKTTKMEDHSQGFVPDDVGFSNYMSGIDSAGWSETVGDEFNIPQNQPQDLNTHYAPPTQSQSIYNQSYGIPQNSYSNVSYNNPYHSHYQQGRSAPGYANASYTLDTPLPPELEELAFHRGWPSFEPSPNRTISPQNLHYGATTSRQSSQSASSQLPYSTAGMSASGIQNLPSFAFSQGQSPDYGYGDFTSNLQQHVNNGINFAPKRTLQTAPPQAAATSGQSFQQTESYNQWNSAFNNPQSQQHYPTDRVKTTEPNQLENTQPKGPPYLRFSGTVMAEKIDQRKSFTSKRSNKASY